ncbi:uncharacterized protein BJ171DRAFT_70077 [Polychytrium aggregatum]|uniref:uncharacterized protein n=1 Tax=Polychytrium aggregatum TaxID=110093 RepID=UPI0022FEA828|nr:uncharacterized protein BJ171DRAFT_70077 [Polychytrium aggregatum]KAI9205221.1 hypothetical protein BJ171DRAFT_70077 [Polychytrium aggregatum]
MLHAIAAAVGTIVVLFAFLWLGNRCHLLGFRYPPHGAISFSLSMNICLPMEGRSSGSTEDFERFLEDHDLMAECPVLIAAGFTNARLVLLMTEDEMRAIGLTVGAMKKVKLAQTNPSTLHICLPTTESGRLANIESRDTFDEFLAEWGLEKSRAVLVESDFDTIDAVLAMSRGDMAQIGLKIGARRKIRVAQGALRAHEIAHSKQCVSRGNAALPEIRLTNRGRKRGSSPSMTASPAWNPNEEPTPKLQHTSAKPSITEDGTSEEVVADAKFNREQDPEPKYFGPEHYTPAEIIPDWECRLECQRHDVFISYRVASESDKANLLLSALISNKRSQSSLHPYLDHLCLCNGQNWEDGFINGLHRSPVIVLLLSEEGLKRTLKAHLYADNQFLEVQHALKLIKDPETRKFVILQPIFIW